MEQFAKLKHDINYGVYVKVIHTHPQILVLLSDVYLFFVCVIVLLVVKVKYLHITQDIDGWTLGLLMICRLSDTDINGILLHRPKTPP